MSPEPPVTNVNLDARDFDTSGDTVLIKGIIEGSWSHRRNQPLR